MPRPARVLATSGACIAGVLLGGSAYVASQAQPPAETLVACVDVLTGVMRVIEPSAGEVCTGDAGAAQERQISWFRAAGSRDSQAPASPPGDGTVTTTPPHAPAGPAVEPPTAAPTEPVDEPAPVAVGGRS